MSSDVFPKNYMDWKVCITEKCGIPLTQEFVTARVEALSDESSQERQKFVELYGDRWAGTVLGYFRQALRELN